MEITLKGTVRYDGTNFAGWQFQPDQRSVQGELERVLSQIGNRPISIQGAGRTDAGVHALGQAFSFKWHKPLDQRLRYAMNQMLRSEIQVLTLETVHDDFNARFDALGKRYAYTLDLGKEPDPFAARYAWHVPYKLDMNLLRALLPQFIGEHDFAAFQSTGSQMKTTVRTIYSLELLDGGLITPCDYPHLYRLQFHGNGFLYKMIRNITGTLVSIARGRYEPDFVSKHLDGPGPFQGYCAPPHGLAMVEVFYPEEK